MQEIITNPVYIWLLLGIFLIAAEAMTAPGMGIFLAGLGALATAIILRFDLVDAANLTWQCISFFAFTSFFALVLWKPLKKLRTSSRSGKHKFHDMIGSAAIVTGNGLKMGETGQVLWSGTIMNAELDSSVASEFVSAGTTVTVKSLSGTTLRVVLK